MNKKELFQRIKQLKESRQLNEHVPLDDEEGGTITEQVVPVGDHWWVRLGNHWLRVQTIPRTRDYAPDADASGPEISLLSGARITTKCCSDGRAHVVYYDWSNGSFYVWII
jgi:hypothetical protein